MKEYYTAYASTFRDGVGNALNECAKAGWELSCPPLPIGKGTPIGFNPAAVGSDYIDFMLIFHRENEIIPNSSKSS